MSSLRIHKPIIIDFGLGADHDMACAVCHRYAAVLLLDLGVFEPCWSCQTRGWQLRKRRWWQRPVRSFF